MKTKVFFIIFGLILSCGFTLRTKKEIEKAGWLIGTWENKTARGSIYETWTKISELEFSGKSYLLKEKDTVVFETIRLIQEQDGLYYIPIVKNQNGGLPVRFASTAISGTRLVFENSMHDFPKIITYTKITADSLVAEISGTKNGQERTVAFPMKRLK